MRTRPNRMTVIDYRDAVRNVEPTARMAGLALEFVTRMVSAPVAMVNVYADVHQSGLVVAKTEPILGVESEILGREYLESLTDDDPILALGLEGGRISLVGSDRLAQHPGFSESALATSFLAGNGFGKILALYLGAGDQQPSFVLTLIRCDEEADFNDREKTFLRHAAPVLAQSLRTAVEFGPAVSDHSAALSGEAGAQLTPREREIAQMAARGVQNVEIGEELHIATGTVKTHLRNIYSKLDVDSRIHLAMRLSGH